MPNPHHGSEPFIRALVRLIEAWNVDVVLPIAEVSALAVLANQDSLGRATVPFPPYDRFVRACDKHFVLEAARSIGIRVPRQRTLRTPEDALTMDPAELDFPLVVKPARSVIENGRGLTKSRVVHAADEFALRLAIGAQPRAAYPLLVQERIMGPGVGIFLLLHDGKPLAVFSHRRIREKPPAGGVSVYRESIPAEAFLLSLSEELLRALDWDGVAMVEYKLDARSGTPYLMEINGRFWGSLQLAIDSGVDFPRLLVELALGDRPQPVLAYRTGVRTRWWLGDVDHLLARLRYSREALALPPEAPGRMGAIGEFVSAFTDRARNEVLRLNDPMPALHEFRNWVQSQ